MTDNLPEEHIQPEAKQETAEPACSMLITGQIEALLFIYGEPMAINKIASSINISKDEVKGGLEALDAQLKQEERGLSLVQDGDRVQLTTRPEHAHLFEKMLKDEFSEDLTPASLETLTIICYTSPTTRAEIDYIRGVNSSFILRALLIRGLIERTVDNKKGNAFLYTPTLDLIKRLGIANISALPDYEEFRHLVRKLNEPGPQTNEENSKETSHTPETQQHNKAAKASNE